MTVYWYGVMAALGFFVAYWTASRRAPLAGISSECVLDLTPWLIGGAIVGARTYYVIAYWQESFAGKPITEIFMLRHGGLVWYGGLIGASLATIIYTRVKGLALWRVADVMAPSIALGHVFGRIGCFLNGCCYGRACSLPWAVHFPPGHETYGTAVHPVQIYESLLNFGLYASLAWLFRRRKFDGQIFALYLVGYALVRAFVEMFRGDYRAAQRYFGGWIPQGQFVSIGILALGMFLFWWLGGKLPKTTPSKA